MKSFLIFKIFFFYSLILTSQNFYYFNITATNDKSRAADVQSTYQQGFKNSQYFLEGNIKHVVKQLGYNLIQIDIINENFNLTYLKNKISNIVFDQRDIVLVYIMSHGQNFNTNSEFPFAMISNFNCNNNQNDNCYLEFESFSKYIYSKNPRLVLSFIDACNNTCSGEENECNVDYLSDNTPWETGLFNEVLSTNMVSNIKTNLLTTNEYKGLIMMCSAKKGQKAILDRNSNNYPNLRFTNFFAPYFKEFTSINGDLKISLDNIAYNFKSKFTSYQKTFNFESNKKQEPYYEIFVEKNIIDVSHQNIRLPNVVNDAKLNEFDKGVEEFYNRNFESAILHFKNAKSKNIAPNYCKLYITISEAYLGKTIFSEINNSNFCELIENISDPKPFYQKEFAYLQYLIAFSYINGSGGCKKDFKKGGAWLYISAENGFKPAIERLAHFHK